jgi:hypothetical protein
MENQTTTDNRVKWIMHKGRRILSVNYSGLQHEPLLAVIKQVRAFYEGQAKASVLAMVDVRGALGSQDVVGELKDVATATRDLDKKSAIIGITGLKKVLLSTINRFSGHDMKAFENEQDALEWLVSETP